MPLIGRAIAAIAVVLTLPCTVLSAVAVWMALGRPVLFSQTRCGLNQRPFKIRKFRSMHDTRDAHGALLADDLRTTPITTLLRRTRLDELPQLWAIVSGDMTFVGPRPLLPESVASFGELGRMRSSVPPGLTGWAQVNGNTKLSDADKLALDVWYVENRSFLLDVRILLKTIPMLIFGERVVEDAVRQANEFVASRAPFAPSCGSLS